MTRSNTGSPSRRQWLLVHFRTSGISGEPGCTTGKMNHVQHAPRTSIPTPNEKVRKVHIHNMQLASSCTQFVMILTYSRIIFKLCLQAPLASCQAAACGQSAKLLSALDRQRLLSMEGSVVQPALKGSKGSKGSTSVSVGSAVTPWSPWTRFGNTCAICASFTMARFGGSMAAPI